MSSSKVLLADYLSLGRSRRVRLHRRGWILGLRPILWLQYAQLHTVSVSKPHLSFHLRKRSPGEEIRTIDKNLHTVSVGCAPTPIQYLARSMSSLMSLCSFPDVSYESFLGIGSYVPMTSRGLLFRAVLQNDPGGFWSVEQSVAS